MEELTSGRTAMETGIIHTDARGIVAVPLQKLHMADALGETFVGRTPELLGLLYLDTRSQAAAVTGLDRQVLQTLAVEGATVIENARLFRLARDQERIQHEMFLARNIQQGLLPRELPQSDYFQVVSITTPTEAVGGDYYDVVALPDGRYGFALADVSGKGLPAALMAATPPRGFRRRRRGRTRPQRTFSPRQRIPVRAHPARKCLPPSSTACWTGRADLNLSMPGTSRPWLCVPRAASSSSIPRISPWASCPTFRSRSITPKSIPGDLIVTTSDGVTEAHRYPWRALWRCPPALSSRRLLRPECWTKWSREILASIREFVGTAPQSDDITMSLVRFGPDPK